MCCVWVCVYAAAYLRNNAERVSWCREQQIQSPKTVLCHSKPKSLLHQQQQQREWGIIVYIHISIFSYLHGDDTHARWWTYQDLHVRYAVTDMWNPMIQFRGLTTAHNSNFNCYVGSKPNAVASAMSLIIELSSFHLIFHFGLQLLVEEEIPYVAHAAWEFATVGAAQAINTIAFQLNRTFPFKRHTHREKNNFRNEKITFSEMLKLRNKFRVLLANID